MNLLKVLNDFLREEDPEGLLKIGAPANEYSFEAEQLDIAFCIHYPQCVMDAFDAVWPVFSNWIGYTEFDQAAVQYYMKFSERLFEYMDARADHL